MARGCPFYLLVLFAVEVLARLSRARSDPGWWTRSRIGERAWRGALHPRRRGARRSTGASSPVSARKLIRPRPAEARANGGIQHPRDRHFTAQKRNCCPPFIRQGRSFVHVSLGTEAAAAAEAGPGSTRRDQGRGEPGGDSACLPRRRHLNRVRSSSSGAGQRDARDAGKKPYRIGLGTASPDLRQIWRCTPSGPSRPLCPGAGRQVLRFFDFLEITFSVTPIQEARGRWTATELLDRVMNPPQLPRSIRRRALFHYPWRGTGYPSALRGLPQGPS